MVPYDSPKRNCFAGLVNAAVGKDKGADMRLSCRVQVSGRNVFAPSVVRVRIKERLVLSLLRKDADVGARNVSSDFLNFFDFSIGYPRFFLGVAWRKNGR